MPKDKEVKGTDFIHFLLLFLKELFHLKFFKVFPLLFLLLFFFLLELFIGLLVFPFGGLLFFVFDLMLFLLFFLFLLTFGLCLLVGAPTHCYKVLDFGFG